MTEWKFDRRVREKESSHSLDISICEEIGAGGSFHDSFALPGFNESRMPPSEPRFM
jgi:hypothetical protein